MTVRSPTILRKEGIPMSERERMAIQENAEFMDQELNRAPQELRDTNSIINEQEREKTRVPGRHQRGAMSRERDRYMRCTFCDKNHYSNSCTNSVSVEDRKRELHVRRRSEMCLETFCFGDRNCVKYFASCYDCRGFGHHPSIVLFRKGACSSRKDSMCRAKHAYIACKGSTFGGQIGTTRRARHLKGEQLAWAGVLRLFASDLDPYYEMFSVRLKML
ncbi:hypothetical protein Aduo_000601 [Ancylostoma duodenale]